MKYPGCYSGYVMARVCRVCARLLKSVAEWLLKTIGLNQLKMGRNEESRLSNVSKISEETYKQVLFNIGSHHGFTFVKFLDSGHNGAVAEMFNPYLRESVAIKIEPFQDEIVIECWTKIKHPNVLPLIAFIRIEDPKDDKIEEEEELDLLWTAYIMPLCPTTLDSKISSSNFRESPEALNEILSWLREILNALEYLHRKNMYHLDLKPNNILLGKQGQAILADFTYLSNRSEITVKNIGCPFPLQPPESLLANKELVLKSDKVDIWCFGMLMADLFTGGSLHLLLNENLEEISSHWSNSEGNSKASPEWVKTRQENLNVLKSSNELETIVKKAYPCSALGKETSKNCSRIFHKILTFKPSERLSITEIIREPFIIFSDHRHFIKYTARRFLCWPRYEAKQCSLHWWEPNYSESH